ncbi:MAG: hypothetical protein ACK51V_00715, partial [bacterium]|jgi:hypothetical protein
MLLVPLTGIRDLQNRECAERKIDFVALGSPKPSVQRLQAIITLNVSCLVHLSLELNGSDSHGTTLSDFCHESARKESWLRAFTC